MSTSSMLGWCKTLGYALAISTGFELLYYFKKRYFNSIKDNNADIDVIFFPDQTVACDAYFSYGCTKENCWLSHTETSSMKVMKFLLGAEKSLDICVYCIASQELIDQVCKAQSRGVVIRVLTDQQQSQEHSLQIAHLRSEGVEVRTNDSTFFMHHKFVIADNRKLMTGSFNWSRNAMLGNNENVLFITKTSVVKKYQNVFDELWSKYNVY